MLDELDYFVVDTFSPLSTSLSVRALFVRSVVG